jgi:acetyl esterase/lipase
VFRIRVKNLIVLSILLFFAVGIVGCQEEGTTNSGATFNDKESIESTLNGEEKEANEHLTINDSVGDLLEHPAFQGFEKHIMPWDDRTYEKDMPLHNIGTLLPYHSHVDPETVVDSLNQMIDEIHENQKVFYDFYSNEQKQQLSSRKDTGLFFFRGNPGAPFAIISPGGGFSYVGSLHEGFPYALELSNRGYNAFVLKYRVGGEQIATDDLISAISYIVKNAEDLEVSVENYSVWGSSAGARMAANAGSFNSEGFIRPNTVVMAYTGHTAFTENDPPTFVTVSEVDRIVDIGVVERRVANLRNAGIDVEYIPFKEAGHGFGLGIGTDAEGWMNQAIEFWEKHMKST